MGGDERGDEGGGRSKRKREVRLLKGKKEGKAGGGRTKGGKEGEKELHPAPCKHKIHVQEINVHTLHTPKVLYSRGKNIMLQKKYAMLCCLYHITIMLRKTDHFAS